MRPQKHRSEANRNMLAETLARKETCDRAVRTLAMSICAETPTHAARLLSISRMNQAEAGITLADDDPEVLALVDEFSLENQQEWDARNRPDRSEDRCPPRE